MTDDAKEWVTIKIPKSVRDDAQADARTYGEIMRAGMESTGEPEPIPAEEFREKFSGVDLNHELRTQLDRIESATQTTEERTNSIQHTLERELGR